MLRSRRFTALAFVLVLLLLAMVFAEETGSGVPDKVTSEAASYAQYLAKATKQDVKVQRIVLAAQPTAFVADMSKTTFGDSVYYGTMYSLASLAASGQAPAARSADRPAPFPPLNLWCVYLGASGKPATAVAFIGEHHDIYNADYILHEAVDAQAALATVGCEAVR